MHGSQDACSYPCLFAAYRVLHRLLAPRHPPYALVHLTYLRSFAFVFANVICLNPKMLGSIHFKLIREANSFNEVRTFVLTIVSVNDKPLTAYLYGEFVFFAFLLLCSFQRSIMVGLTRLELVTSRLSGVRSNQLSYRPIFLCSSRLAFFLVGSRASFYSILNNEPLVNTFFDFFLYFYKNYKKLYISSVFNHRKVFFLSLFYAKIYLNSLYDYL